jgi:type IV pilus assembly protein PilO
MKFGAREVLFLIVMLSLLFASWYFVFRKADERIATLNADTLQMQNQLGELDRVTKRIANMNQKIEELQKLIRLFEGKIPRQNETKEIVKQIDKQARGRRLLDVVSFDARSKAEQAAGYFELPVKIVMTGDFKSFYDFLLEIERMTRITRINKMSLTKINEVDGSMKADVTLSIFFAPDNARAK